MNYEPRLSPSAEEQFAKLPAVIQDLVERELYRLVADPHAVIQQVKATYYLTVSTLLTLEESFYDGNRRLIFIPFRFNQDEIHLDVLAIAVGPVYPTS